MGNWVESNPVFNCTKTKLNDCAATRGRVQWLVYLRVRFQNDFDDTINHVDKKFEEEISTKQSLNLSHLSRKIGHHLWKRFGNINKENAS